MYPVNPSRVRPTERVAARQKAPPPFPWLLSTVISFTIIGVLTVAVVAYALLKPQNLIAGFTPTATTAAQTPTIPAQPVTSDLSALSPNLAQDLQGQGNNVHVALYVPGRNHYYVYNPDQSSIMASTVKIPIVTNLLHVAEQQNRSLTPNEQDLATRAIENSDNDAGQYLYTTYGYYNAVNAYLASIGVTGITMSDLMGYSQASPLGMVHLLDTLRVGKILNDADRQFLFGLMANISQQQQFGIGETAPQGATYLMKDGWITAAPPDNSWTVGTVGIVTLPNKTVYVLAVYVQEQNDEGSAWAIADPICKDIAAALGK
jgi:beta-lactamase class A